MTEAERREQAWNKAVAQDRVLRAHFDKLSPSQTREYESIPERSRWRYEDAVEAGSDHRGAMMNVDKTSTSYEERQRSPESLVADRATSAVSAYEKLLRQVKFGTTDPEVLEDAKRILRKRRSELIKAEKTATGPAGMRVRLALMQVRSLLK